MRTAHRVLVTALVAVTAVGCVSTNEIGGSDNATPTTTTVAPTPGSFGEDISYGTDGGVTATVVDVQAFQQSPNGVPRISVVMRAENLSHSVQRNPDVELLCSETTNTGDWFLGSTWEPNVVLPVNAVTQGEVIIGFPLKGTNPEYPVVTCSAPMLRLTILDATGDLPPKVVTIPVDPAIITAAIREPRGPVLPLPPTGS